MRDVYAIASGYRTGSTHAYMIVRAILAVYGVPHHARGISDANLLRAELRRLRGSKPLVLKTHNLFIQPRRRLRVIVTRRHPVDAVASRLRIHPKASIDAVMRDLALTTRNEALYRDRPDVLFVDYDPFYGRDGDKVDAIAQHMGYELTLEQISEVVDRTSIEAARRIVAGIKPTQGMDKHTELRPGHISDAGGRPASYPPLSAEIMRRIEEVIGATA